MHEYQQYHSWHVLGQVHSFFKYENIWKIGNGLLANQTKLQTKANIYVGTTWEHY